MPSRVCPFCGSRRLRESPVSASSLCCRDCEREFDAFSTQEQTRRSAEPTTRSRSDRQERFNARSVGGRVTANSGAGRDKGDVKVRGLLREEDKTTGKTSYVLKRADLRKIAAAAQGDEIPVMSIAFEDNLNEQFVVVPRGWFEQLLRSYQKEIE